MKQPLVYLDTSFFIGYCDDPARRPLAEKVLDYEIKQSSKLYTSILTINEFVVRAYDLFKRDTDCDTKVELAINSITDLAQIYGFNQLVMKESARLMSVWGEFRKLQEPPLPRDRKFRWDAIHIATAHILKADRVYAFDGPWDAFPKKDIPNITEIIHPANFGIPPLFKATEKITVDATTETTTSAPVSTLPDALTVTPQGEEELPAESNATDGEAVGSTPSNDGNGAQTTIAAPLAIPTGETEGNGKAPPPDLSLPANGDGDQVPPPIAYDEAATTGATALTKEEATETKKAESE